MTRFMWFSPASSETLSSATIPPKRRLTFSTSSRATATARSTLRPSRNEGHWLDRSFQTGVWAQLTRPDGRRRRVGALAAVRRAALVLVLALAVPSAARTSLPGQEGGNRSTLQALARAAAPLYCGGRHGRYVALTFDDGPGPYTARLLRILARAGARATFFVIGSRVAAWPGLVREEVRRGAVGNHTWSHPRRSTRPHTPSSSRSGPPAAARSYPAAVTPAASAAARPSLASLKSSARSSSSSMISLPVRSPKSSDIYASTSSFEAPGGGGTGRRSSPLRILFARLRRRRKSGNSSMSTATPIAAVRKANRTVRTAKPVKGESASFASSSRAPPDYRCTRGRSARAARSSRFRSQPQPRGLRQGR